MSNLFIIAFVGSRLIHTTSQAHTSKIAKLVIPMNVSITLSISLKMLTDIQKNVKGKNRAEKLRRCIEFGYPLATKQPPNH